MSKPGSEDAQLLAKLALYPNPDDLNDAALALSLIVDTFLDGPTSPLDPLYTHVGPCTRLLTRQPGLYDSLKSSHAARSFEAIRTCPALRLQPYSKKLPKVLEEITLFFKALVKDKQSPVSHTWTPDSLIVKDPVALAQVQALGILTTDRPHLILNDLGTMGSDAVFEQRVENIFQRARHTFLVNASGSGKTRLAYEGLCRHWGFYFTSVVDSGLGSNDIGRIFKDDDILLGLEMTLPPTDSPRFPVVRDGNIRAVHSQFNSILLARLLVFQLFAECICAAGVSDEHKKIWLLFQLNPSLPRSSSDVFELLSSYLTDNDDLYIQDHIHYTQQRLRESLATATHDALGRLLPDFHLFYVLDEAQIPATTFPDAFHENGVSYPILREIMGCWAQYSSPREISYVIAGIEIPRRAFDGASNSELLRWCSDTGSFDQKAVQRRYVLKYLPPALATSATGEYLLERIWRWCRGRYRFTTTLVMTLARDGFQCPHLILSDYVRKLTGHQPTDASTWIEREDKTRYRSDVWVEAISCEKLETIPSLKSALQDTLYHCLLSAAPAPLYHDIHAVNLGYGVFIDNNLQNIKLDEPLIVVTVGTWLGRFSYLRGVAYESFQVNNLFAGLVRDLPTTKTLAKVLAFYFQRVFDAKYPLSTVFSFPHEPVPAWAKETAELVGVQIPSMEEGRSVVPADNLAIQCRSMQETLLWLEDGLGTAFCLPSTATPDLAFTLKLSDATLVRVVLQVYPTSEILQGSVVESAIKSLDNSNMFRHEDSVLHDRAIELLGKGSALSTHQTRKILRVVAAFPAKVLLKPEVPKGTSDTVNLNTGLFRRITKAITTPDILDLVIKNLHRPCPESFHGTNSKRKDPPDSDDVRRSKFQKL
ncbi:hypothetical protein C8R46DRAFT_1118978 [Mycena filopes]|nr:hypothetical protein C8R46DRAFT_1118978 [Mycena filopes]